MSSSYELCPAIKHDGGYLVIRRVEKAFPVFLRCAAAHFPLGSPATADGLRAAEVCGNLEDFSAATARLVSQPMLRPFEGGVPVLVYVARPGKEELFLEFAEGLEQADDFKLLLALPSAGRPLALVFGDPAVPLSAPAETAMTGASADPNATVVHLRSAAPAAPDPLATPDEMPTWTPADLPTALRVDPPEPTLAIEAELQPAPMAAAEPTRPAAPDEASLPPVEVVETTTHALNDLLRPGKPEAMQPQPPAVDVTQAPASAEDMSEPALEILLRQAPRLQAPETELSQVQHSAPEAGRGPAPEEVLVAVRQMVGALDDALRRQTAEHQTALQAVIVATERAVQQQGQVLEARLAEHWERQQAALRQMHTEQSSAIEGAIVRLDEERAAWQQRALRDLQQTSAQQLPGALRQLQDDLATRQQQALNQLREDLLSRQMPATSAPAAASPLTSAADLETLNWQLEKSAVSSQDLRLRVGQLLWVNLLLIVGLVGLAIGAFWLLRTNLTPAPSPALTPTVVAASATPIPPTAVPPTPLPPTTVPSTPTAAATATTALPVFLAALSCANTERPRNFYDCELTNSGDETDTLALAVRVVGEELNGFRPLVLNPDQSRVRPDPITGLFALGPVEPGQTLPVRVMLPCAVVTGCSETTFEITPLVDNGQTIVADQVVEVTTHYFPP